MQIRNKAINYFEMKDIVIIWYEITSNPRYLGYRMIYYNKQIMNADDIINYYDNNTSTNSPTQ